MKKLFVAVLLVAAAAGYWTFGMTAEQRASITAKVLSIPEWSPVSLSD
jgi:hypothetical protein